MNIEELEIGEMLVDLLEAKRNEWLELRSGKITCSKFGDLIGTGRTKDSVFTQAGMTYLKRLVAERLGSWYVVSAKSLEWGTENEQDAISIYRKFTGFDVSSEPYTYIAFDDDIGGTPDGIVWGPESGCIEVKCPYDPAVHVNTMLTRQVPEEYYWQCVGHMLVTGGKWCDFISYDPRIAEKYRLVIVRVNRDSDEIARLRARLCLAVDTITSMLSTVRK
jgi:hypothetical protein